MNRIWRPLVDVVVVLALIAAAAEIAYLRHHNERLERVIETGGGDITEGSGILPLHVTAMDGTSLTIRPEARRLFIYVGPGCGSCARAMPMFQEIITGVGAANTIVLAPVVRDNSLADLRNYARTQHLTHVQVAGLSRSTMAEFRMYSLPRILLVDAKGQVVRVFTHPTSTLEVINAFKAIKGESNA